MILCLLPSTIITPFYTYLASSSGNAQLATHLTYTKIIADALGRPMAGVLKRVRSKESMLAYAIVRFVVVVPLFFIYVEQHLPLSDVAVFVFIFVASWTSGYLNTAAYRLGAASVPQSSKFDAAAFIGCSFQLGFYLSFSIDYLLLHSVHWKYCDTHVCN